MNRRLFAMLFVTAGVVLAAQEGVSATVGVQQTLDFDTVPTGNMPATTPPTTFTEGDYSIAAASGTLSRSGLSDIEGSFNTDGGVLSIQRTDGGLFTFDEATIHHWNDIDLNSWTTEIQFSATVNGAVVQDTFITAPGDTQYSTHTSNQLNGVAITELRIALDANIYTPGFGFYEGVNSLKLTAVPEPTSLALIGVGGLLAMRRRR